jgi:hypothetical protein
LRKLITELNKQKMSKEAIKYYEENRIVGDYLDKVSVVSMMNGFHRQEQDKQLNLSGVGSSGSEFEKDLFKLIHNYCKNGLKKPELVKKMEWVLGSCKMS